MKLLSSTFLLAILATGVIGFADFARSQDGEIPPEETETLPPAQERVECGDKSTLKTYNACKTRSSSVDEGPSRATERARVAVQLDLHIKARVLCDVCPPGGNPDQLFCKESIVETSANITTTPPAFNLETNRWNVTGCYNGTYKIECAEDCDDSDG
ncbi:MAG: hypothetical protein GY711_29080 [bacterium]|nr:hypothetical protein [bacterium]